jgi:hypothetical protein
VRVVSGPRILEFAGPERVRQLLRAPNATAVRKRKTGEVVCVLLEPHGDDSRLHARGGNPQRLSHDCETEDNPPRVWTFKKLPHV